MAHQVVLISGDGIGPEVARATCKILEAAGAPVQFEEAFAGASALDKVGEVLPDVTVERVREVGVALKGPCTTPVGKGYSSVNVQLRKRLDLYGAVRPIRNLVGLETPFSGVDLVVIRENTEGLYSGIEHEVTPGVFTALKVATERACKRIVRFGFEYAKKRNREKVSVFHKANIMKLTDGLMLRAAEEVSAEYPSVELHKVIIDAGCMKLVQNPSQFDVLVTGNLYGDILSDLCAGFVGGLGVVPGANIGESSAIFEAVHGSAPDIAGKGVANPLALLMSAVMMLNHLAETRDDAACSSAAAAIRQAYDKALSDGQKTRDLGGALGTDSFADAVIERLS